MIEFHGVSKRYGRARGSRAALQDITLAIPAGSVWAIVGPNGAGKSTLLSLLLGFIRPTRGTITIDEEPPRDYLLVYGAGYLPERFNLPPEWPVGAALQLLARLSGTADTDTAIQRLGLEAHLDKRASQLSRGLLQRVGLAQALLTAAPLVVLDEPTEGLDPLWRIRLRDIIGELRAQQRTVIMASHDLTEVERVTDRAVVLDNGTVRDMLDTRPVTAVAEFIIRLGAPCAAIAEAFPAAQPVDEVTFVSTVSGASELTERLSALIALGATIEAVQPLHSPLEQRVRDALEQP